MTAKYKIKNAKSTQRYPGTEGNSVKWNKTEHPLSLLQGTTEEETRKGYLERRQIPTTECATLPQSLRFSVPPV